MTSMTSMTPRSLTPRSLTPRSLVMLLLALLALPCPPARPAPEAPAGSPSVRIDASGKMISLAGGPVRLHLRLEGGCVVDSLRVGARDLVGPDGGAFTGIRIDSLWYDSRRVDGALSVTLSGDSVRISNIRFKGLEGRLTEDWTLVPVPEGIRWSIERRLFSPMTLDDNAFPAVRFDSIGWFESALLGQGGVAWFRLFNDSALAYGVHTGQATLWSPRDPLCLRLEALPPRGENAIKFMRERQALTCAFAVSDRELSYRYDAGTHRRRFIRGKTDVWRPTLYPAATYRQTLLITAPGFDAEYGRGEFRGVDGQAVNELLNTIARLGVIDARHFGGNSWHTPYGPLCLHEQYIAQFGVGIDDPCYVQGYKECLEYYRDHAVMPDGRVKSRWAYTDEDAMPGTADSLGFYEAQWGFLMDSQPDLVINVAELFDQSGDVQWLRRQKASCEKALDYLLRRDADHDHLVEVMTDAHTEARGSDWIDIIWASWENALVNAEMYHALNLWSDLEELLGDTSRASSYRAFAGGLKVSFNKSTAAGGFWDEKNGWYVYWLDRDGSVHGNNLVTPVNFMAIAYGLCDDPARKRSIIRTVEEVMRKEHLFFWPLNIFPYRPGEGKESNFPYPSYENGDLFLSWGEIGVRAYVDEDPDLALRYCRNVIDRFKKDGLAFQRYLRGDQSGAGDDILSGNAAIITGLYRDIYGIQPRYNRLALRPRLVKDLYGTRLRYRYQGKEYRIALDGERNTVAVDGCEISAPGDFGVRSDGRSLTWFAGNSAVPAMTIGIPAGPEPARKKLSVIVHEWRSSRSWTERGASTVDHEIAGLEPGLSYVVRCNGRPVAARAGRTPGSLRFTVALPDGAGRQLEVSPASP